MSWTPNIISSKREGSHFRVLVGFLNNTDGSSTSEEYLINTPDLEGLKVGIKNKVDTLTAQDGFSVPLGSINTTPTPPVLTQAQIDQQQFIDDYQLWLKVKRAIDNQVITGSEPAVVNLKNKVQSEFKPAYLNLL